MLNIFPVQFLAPLAYALLRICVGFIFIRLGYSHIKARQELKNVFTLPIAPFGLFFAWYVGILEIVIGTLFILGLFTQIAALLATFYCIKLLILRKRFSHPLLPRGYFLTLLLMTSISIFITGAGAFAFDLPI
jgi:putative oxidoreductase